MAFQDIPKVEDPETYIDITFHAGERAGSLKRNELKGTDVTRLIRSRIIETAKIGAVQKTGVDVLLNLVRQFPSLDRLDPFYLALVKCTLDYDFLKKSLGGVMWAADRLDKLANDALRKIKATRDLEHINAHRQAFYGRTASVFKQIKTNLKYLEESRKTLKKFPPIKTDIPTVVIAGAPNVGKSSLLSALTGSTPKIAPYPFTTQNLMLGYLSCDGKKIQLIDTPGLLDRPLEHRNPIEKQAVLALKHLAKAIIFVLDPSEACGYPFQEQLNLLAEIKRSFPAPVIVVANKSDLQHGKKLAPDTIMVSAEKKIGIDDVKHKIVTITSQDAHSE
ncbi:50S ribosome-binding GTPase [Candidatus Woesearchaeota archaeon]|nr:50S ribosome-binding GTPase [Candidatus Woesearchaeota archaeon]